MCQLLPGAPASITACTDSSSSRASGKQEGSSSQAASLAHPLENLFREILFPAKKIQEFLKINIISRSVRRAGCSQLPELPWHKQGHSSPWNAVRGAGRGSELSRDPELSHISQPFPGPFLTSRLCVHSSPKADFPCSE